MTARRGAAGLALGLAWLAAATAGADVFHYNDHPLGERAAGMAGAFAALSDDPSGAWHNPAGLANAPFDSFSLSLSLYQLRFRRIHNYRDGHDLTTDSFNVVSASTGSVFAHQRWRFAFTANVPEADEGESRFAATGRPPYWHLDRSFKNREMYVGPSAAYQFHPQATMGVSLFLYHRSEHEVFSRLEESGGRFAHRLETADRAYLGLAPLFGLWLKPHPQARVGLTLRSGFAAHSRSTFRIIETTNNPDVEPVRVTTRTDQEALDAPLSFRAGLAWVGPRGTTVAADLSVHDHWRYAMPTRTVMLNAVANLNLGVEHRFWEWYAIRAGFYTDFSAASRGRRSDVDAPPAVDIFGGTLAFAWEDGLTSTMLGLHGGGGEGTTVEGGRRLAMRDWFVGLMVGGSVRFDQALEKQARRMVLDKRRRRAAEPEPERAEDVLRRLEDIEREARTGSLAAPPTAAPEADEAEPAP